MEIKFKRLIDTAFAPTYGSIGAAAVDLYAAEACYVKSGMFRIIDTGIAVELPKGYALMVYSRSGHGFKNGVRLANSVGVIDSDYRGSIKVCLHNDRWHQFDVAVGDRIAQAMIIEVPSMVFVEGELSDTERDFNGFGSTGR